MPKRPNYKLDAGSAGKTFPAPALPYEPRGPRRFNPPIAVIGTGGIADMHLSAYRDAGLNVVALCNRTPAKAAKLGKRFFPDAEIYSDYRRVLDRDDVPVVDITTHPDVRATMVADAVRAGKHVLSQKPFATDLRVARRLVELADRHGVRVAVNQNGRWAPHFSYIRHAIAAGLVGDVLTINLSVHWDHDWIVDTAFNDVRHIVLFDFGIHWFDILTTFLGGRSAASVFATLGEAPGQTADPPLLANALVDYGDAQASLTFNAFARHGKQDQTLVVGTKGTLLSTGVDLHKQRVTFHTRRGTAEPELAGTWFPGGFAGTMLELLRAIERDREPTNSARDNLTSLALSFAACRSADTSKPQVPGKVGAVSD